MLSLNMYHNEGNIEMIPFEGEASSTYMFPTYIEWTTGDPFD